MTTPKIPPKVFYHVTHRPAYVTCESKVYFEAVLPMALKDRITGSGAGGKKTACVGHLMEMLDCLKRTGYNDGPCKQQIRAFKECNEVYKKTEQLKKERGDEDIRTITNAKEMKRDQVNLLLKNFHKRS